MDSLRSIIGKSGVGQPLKTMNRDAEQVQAALFQFLGSMDQPNCWGSTPSASNATHSETLGEIFSCHELALRASPLCTASRLQFSPPSVCLTFVFRDLCVIFVHSFARPFTISCFHHIRSVFKLHLFHNMKFFTVLSVLGLVAAAVAQQTTHNSTVTPSTLSTSTSASLTPEESCVADCKLQAP